MPGSAPLAGCPLPAASLSAKNGYSRDMNSTHRIVAASITVLCMALGAWAKDEPAAVGGSGPTLSRVLSPMDSLDSVQDLKGNWAAVREDRKSVV